MKTGASLESVYSAMKAGQIGFVKALSQELALSTVTVNAIAPGFVSGRMTQVFDDDTLTEMVESLPQQRLIDPQEIAHTCSLSLSSLCQEHHGYCSKSQWSLVFINLNTVEKTIQLMYIQCYNVITINDKVTNE
ncbi:3-oxoacyl-ACP reductase [Staphylococcus gallinarum]|uniref:3-oxoacyl-ACP reductase n=1 Tax=Staphylococcus gallinarum TaxID=1293 RepID=A0A380FF11_STAGA|nr:3-oxoacyl-ACP reductase [Staphylococcus gallinarum]